MTTNTKPDDGLSRCDDCFAVVPHNRLIARPVHRRGGLMRHLCVECDGKRDMREFGWRGTYEEWRAWQ